LNALLFLGIAFLILIPAVIYLPLGFRKSGKGIILILSFANALLGLMALNLFPMWKMVLLITLLNLTVSYLVGTKFNNVIFGREEQSLEEKNEFSKVVKDVKIDKEYLSPLSFSGVDNGTKDGLGTSEEEEKEAKRVLADVASTHEPLQVFSYSITKESDEGDLGFLERRAELLNIVETTELEDNRDNGIEDYIVELEELLEEENTILLSLGDERMAGWRDDVFSVEEVSSSVETPYKEAKEESVAFSRDFIPELDFNDVHEKSVKK